MKVSATQLIIILLIIHGLIQYVSYTDVTVALISVSLAAILALMAKLVKKYAGS